MSTEQRQALALRLADNLETLHLGGLGAVRANAAYQLRRLHALNTELVAALEMAEKALVHHTSESQPAAQIVRAALAKAKAHQ